MFLKIGLLLLWAFGVMIAVRNIIAYSIQQEALSRVSALAKREIESHYSQKKNQCELVTTAILGRYHPDHEYWRYYYDRYNETSYYSILFNPLIWTTRQAYPWLFESDSDAG